MLNKKLCFLRYRGSFFLAFSFNQHSAENVHVTFSSVFVDFKSLVYFNEKLLQKKSGLVI